MTSPLTLSARSPLLCTLPLRSPDSPLIDANVAALVAEAAAAGFASVSVCTTHPKWGLADPTATARFFDALGPDALPIHITDVINVDLWGAGDRDATDAAHGAALDLCARTGAAAVNTIAYQPEMPPLAQAAEHLGRLCDQAAERGLRISLEFLPFTGVAGIRTASRLLEATDRDNLGLVLDLWHWTRSPEGPDVDALRAIPPERIHVLQLCDAPAQPADDLALETVTARRLPGDGDADIAAVLDALDAMGAAPVVCTEVFSDALIAAGPAENVRRQFAGVQAAFAGRA